MNNFLCVKSIITITLVGTFCFLTILHPEQYGKTLEHLVFSVVSIYLGTQFQKAKKDGENK